ncbi:hypothetical protein GP486_000321 [Trichoglossum hirsutum]|uniref:Inositol-1-monophosphatase n=1 Tax=Trichoglossum hirsutum TaxID=265104 RepID=A0A9P8RTP2_9PEZI|nr:hypothetical protein GP486_000321 [Trichoglossum hirsutum]
MTVVAHEPNLQEIHDFLVELAKKAGEMALAANPSTLTADSKKNSSDLVTETDQAIEKMVYTALKAKYINYEFLGEETYKPGMKLTDAPTFICDPIDGTINFVHAFPNVCISLGFTIMKKPVVGVIYNPFQHRMFTAIRGCGAYLNLTTRLPLKARPEPLTGLTSALIAVEWGSDRSGRNWDTRCKTVRRLVGSAEEGGAMVHSLRCMGSAALNFCAVAAGYVDAFWEGGCWAWDVAAGWVILEEAGGIVVDANPGNWEPTVDGRKYLAIRAAPSGQKEIIEELWSNVVGTYDYTS